MIVQVNIILNRTVVDSDWRFDNLSGYWSDWSILGPNVIGRLSESRDVIGYEDS